MKINFCRKIFFFITFFLSVCFSQERNNLNEVNQFLKLADYYLYKDYTKSLFYGEKALSEAIKLNDSYRKALSYYYISKSYVFFRKFDKSEEFITKGFDEEAVENDKHLKALFFILKGGNYSRMSLLEEALSNNKRALVLVESNSDVKSVLILASINSKIADYYTEKQQYDSAHFYADKSIAIIDKIPLEVYMGKERIYQFKPFIYFYKSWIFLAENKPKEAYPFIEKAYHQALLEKIDYLALFYEIYGDYYSKIENYHKAIDFYLLAESNRFKFKQNSAYLNSKIAICYNKLKDFNKEAIYLKKSKQQFEIDRREDVRIIKSELVRNQKQFHFEQKRKDVKYFLIVLVGLTFFVMSSWYIISRSKKIRSKKRAIINTQNVKLEEAEFEINSKEKMIEELEIKLNNSYAELSDLFRDNSSLFWGKFQEIYPHFLTRLLEINPSLKGSEVVFCSYIYLGFSNKEIAEYTFKSIRTIENNRYRLRKNFCLNTNEDFSLWLKKQIDLS